MSLDLHPAQERAEQRRRAVEKHGFDVGTKVSFLARHRVTASPVRLRGRVVRVPAEPFGDHRYVARLRDNGEEDTLSQLIPVSELEALP